MKDYCLKDYCYVCKKETEFKGENITYIDDLAVLMCDGCVKEY